MKINTFNIIHTSHFTLFITSYYYIYRIDIDFLKVCKSVIDLLSRWSPNIHFIISQLIQEIKRNRNLVNKLPFILQHFSSQLIVEEIFKSFANILETEEV
jgi:hypothetical protein